MMALGVIGDVLLLQVHTIMVSIASLFAYHVHTSKEVLFLLT